MTLIDIHTHKDYSGEGIITVRNTYPGEGFGAFRSSNYYSVGLHPWHIKSPDENNLMLKQVEQACEFKHVIFIGECGLDKNCGTNFLEQERVFCWQVELAEIKGKPIIIHSVKADNEILGFRKKLKAKTPWIMHGYSGNFEEAEKLAKYGFMFSFGKNLFNNTAKAIEAFKELPINLIFLETDEFSGTSKEIYAKASELKGIDISLLAKMIELNFIRITGKI